MQVATDFQIVTLPLDQFARNPVQDASRESAKAVKSLMHEVQRSGWIAPVLVGRPLEDGRYPLITGHRRHTVAGMLSLETLQAVVLPVDAITDSFVAEANGNKNVTGRNYLIMWAQGADVSRLPVTAQKQISTLISWVGERALRALANLGMAPSMVNEVEAIRRVFSAFRPNVESVPKPDAILYWLVEHHQTAAVRAARSKGVTQGFANRLAKAIINQREL